MDKDYVAFEPTSLVPVPCNREVYFFADVVKWLCPDQRNLQHRRQNPILLPENETYETLERTKLPD